MPELINIRDLPTSVSERRVVVVGAGPAAHRFVTALRGRGDRSDVVVLGEESVAPYDRVNLAKHWDPDHDLSLTNVGMWNERTHLVTNAWVNSIDPERKSVHVNGETELAYDELVLATGSAATMPPLPGNDLAGVYVYRTVNDVDRMRANVEALSSARGPEKPPQAVVIGGGLLGLEAAGGLVKYGFETHLVHSRDWLMSSQLDEGGGRTLNRAIEQRGIELHLGQRPSAVLPAAADPSTVGGVAVGEDLIEADLVVWAIGITPRDELARDAGLETAPNGGVPIDTACRTATPGIWAIGEVASFDGTCVGLVAPANAMAEVVAAQLTGGDDEFTEIDDATKLKLHGLDVASFGDSLSRKSGTLDVVMSDPVEGVYQKLVLSDDARTLLGGVFVGDAEPYASLRALLGRQLPGAPRAYLSGGGDVPDAEMPDDLVACSCNNVTVHEIKQAVGQGCHDLASVKKCSKAGTQCGSCVGLVGKIMTKEMEGAGLEISKRLCEHFELSRPELFEAIRLSRLTSFTQVIEKIGTGRGCDICKPVVANILATAFHEHVLDGGRDGLQDTNDRALANMQKDGTYSVVPRIPGGEITPEKLAVIAQVAKEFNLYTKITGAQRIDLLGARLEQLPQIWQRLIDAGMESGQAYGKSLRAVKSCVGSAWCRYGVQDSVGMAVHLENRYRGLRSPHKLKIGVSGCARECAEARGKDVGVIATDKGWNVYVGGNGGFTPRHAELLVSDVDDRMLVKVIDRFFMYYIRSAERLQRTAPWFESLEGGMDHLREVILEDSLGICDELESAMGDLVADYRDEWAETLNDPVKLARFTPFINDPQATDETIVQVPERGQVRPATAGERVMISGPTIGIGA